MMQYNLTVCLKNNLSTVNKLLLFKNNHISTPPSNHPIWSIAGVTRSMYTGDLMHSGDLGPCLHLHGSTMSDLISYTGPYVGAGPAEFRVQRLKVDVDSAYATCGIKKRINTLTQKMIKGKRGPILKAKASEARNLLGPLEQLLTELDDGSEKRGHQLLAYSSLFKMYQVIIQSGLFLSTSEFKLVFKHLKHFCCITSGCMCIVHIPACTTLCLNFITSFISSGLVSGYHRGLLGVMHLRTLWACSKRVPSHVRQALLRT